MQFPIEMNKESRQVQGVCMLLNDKLGGWRRSPVFAVICFNYCMDPFRLHVHDTPVWTQESQKKNRKPSPVDPQKRKPHDILELGTDPLCTQQIMKDQKKTIAETRKGGTVFPLRVPFSCKPNRCCQWLLLWGFKQMRSYSVPFSLKIRHTGPQFGLGPWLKERRGLNLTPTHICPIWNGPREFLFTMSG